ncbi:MAG TPA: MFS transporter [Candidatus Dormibacteraeota bacterium]
MNDVQIEEQRSIEEIEQARTSLRQVGRAAMGVSGKDEAAPFWRTLRQHQLSVYTLVAIGLLVIVDQFQDNGFYILGPEISRGLGMPRQLIGLFTVTAGFSLAVASLPLAWFVERKPRRGVVAIVTGMGWALVTLFTGFVTSPWALLGVLVADGVTSGSVLAIHGPLLSDTYPPSIRSRVLSGYSTFVWAGAIIAPLMVFWLTGPLDFTWRGTFLIMGLICCGAALFALRLKDPGFGRWDTQELREVVRREEHRSEEGLQQSEYELHFFEIARRLFMVPTLRRIFYSAAVYGMMTVPLNTYFVFFLEDKWGLGPSQRALFFAGTPVFAIAVIFLLSRYGDRLLSSDPARLFRLASVMQALGMVSLLVSVAAPVFPLVFIFFGLTSAFIATLVPLARTAYYSVLRPQMRPHVAALEGIFLTGVGGIAGAILLGGISVKYGTVGALVATIPFGLISALVLRSAAKTVNGDLDHTVEELLEEEELQALKARGVRLPMLSCRSIDFAYDQLQVLFGVDFTVDDGEMVALLGTNGAGKSTLLRVISGLGLPTRGSVRYRGADITYLDPERRVGLGITQVPGGRAVFSGMSVLDNLRVFGHLHGGQRRLVERGIEESLAAFPRLAERRHQPAGVLSGGEQQMLGLAKAFMLKPQLLLIDELSLGLAPKVVAELLEMVRRINQSGTAVVLVEQSVNVALTLVEHAYFMEKGEIRFDGKAADLLDRPDLLRSVFLEGATGAGGNGRGRPAAVKELP